jgi:hypothetical protein
MRNEMHRDNGYASRKLWFAFYSTALLLIGGLLGHKYPGFGALYGEFVGGVVAVVATLFGGNVATKWLATRAPADKAPVEQLPKEESPQ